MKHDISLFMIIFFLFFSFSDLTLAIPLQGIVSPGLRTRWAQTRLSEIEALRPRSWVWHRKLPLRGSSQLQVPSKKHLYFNLNYVEIKSLFVSYVIRWSIAWCLSKRSCINHNQNMYIIEISFTTEKALSVAPRF